MECYNMECSYRSGNNINKYYCSDDNCAFIKICEIRSNYETTNKSLRRCGNDWKYCDGNCYNCKNTNYKMTNAIENPLFKNAKPADVFFDLSEQEKEKADWKADVEMKLFHLNEEVIRLRKMVENNDYKPKD